MRIYYLNYLIYILCTMLFHFEYNKVSLIFFSNLLLYLHFNWSLLLFCCIFHFIFFDFTVIQTYVIIIIKCDIKRSNKILREHSNNKYYQSYQCLVCCKIKTTQLEKNFFSSKKNLFFNVYISSCLLILLTCCVNKRI